MFVLSTLRFVMSVKCVFINFFVANTLQLLFLVQTTSYMYRQKQPLKVERQTALRRHAMSGVFKILVNNNTVKFYRYIQSHFHFRGLVNFAISRYVQYIRGTVCPKCYSQTRLSTFSHTITLSLQGILSCYLGLNKSVSKTRKHLAAYQSLPRFLSMFLFIPVKYCI